MRLLFVIDNLGSGGAQRQLVNLSMGLVSRGHHVEIFTYFPQYEYFISELSKEIVIHKYSKKNRLDITPAIYLRKLIKYRSYDAILAYLSTPSFYTELSCLGRKHPPLIVSERSIIYKFRSDPIRAILQFGHVLADWVVFNSHHTYSEYLSKFPWMRSKTSVIYNGVDLTKFTMGKKNTQNNPVLNLLAIGSVVPNKNPIGLARAIAYCRDQLGINCRLDWAGKIIGESTKYNEYIRVNEIINELNLENQWKWLGERKDIVDLLLNHDALIHPSFFEGLPNAICEAFACGCPVLSSNVGDNQYLIGDNVRGLLFDPNDIHNMAQTIYKFSKLSEDQRQKMRDESRRFAERELSLEKNIQQYEILFDMLINKNR